MGTVTHELTHRQRTMSPVVVNAMSVKPTVRTASAGVFTKGKNYANIQEATAAGLDGASLQRYREAELTHGRVSILATVGFLVGEQVEGSSFLFDAQVTGPAVNHFQQVPTPFWFAIGATIAIAESTRVQAGWQDPGQSDKLFLLKDGYTPGDLNFDPLGLGRGKSEEELDDLHLGYDRARTRRWLELDPVRRRSRARQRRLA